MVASDVAQAGDVLWRTIRYQCGDFEVFAFEDQDVDARDARKHVSQLKTRVMPKGMATETANDYEWSFSYDEKGNLVGLLDHADEETLVGVDDHGCRETVTDARLKVTTFGACDANGQPTTITDANGRR